MMRTKLLGSVTAAMLVGPLTAQATTVTMELTGVLGAPVHGVYTSPYTALIGAPGQTTGPITGVSTPIICDDFFTDVGLGLIWQATATNMSTLSNTVLNGTVKFDNGTIPQSPATSAAQQQADYFTVGYLSQELTGVSPTSLAGEAYSYAVWAVFDPASLTDLASSSNLSDQAVAALAATDLSAAKGAITSLAPSAFADVTIYTPNPADASQEYIVVNVPEPATLSLLGLGLLGAGFAARRRPARA